MNMLKRITLASLFAVLVWAVPSAQTYLYGIHNTTLSAAVSATTTTFTVGSCTAIAGSSFGNCAVGWAYYVDREFGRITAVSGTTLTVQRPLGAGSPDGTGATSHASSARIFLGPPNAFKEADPNYAQGSGSNCTIQPVPWINIKNGNVWVCRGGSSTGVWSVTNAMPVTYNSVAPGLPW